MIIYSANVLPSTEGAYQLKNARISNEVLYMQADSRVYIELTETQLDALYEHMQLEIIAAPGSGNLDMTLGCAVKAITQSNRAFTYYCNVALNANGIFSTELEFVSEKYSFLSFELFSQFPATLASWELRPENLGELETVIDGVQQSLPRLLYDYNVLPRTVAQQISLVGMIACDLHGNTDLQGHFLLSCESSERCYLFLRFYDNDMQELFSPVQFLLEEGQNTVSVPHAYLRRRTGLHTLYVTAQTTNGSLDIPTRGILYTIDGGYLAERLISPGMDLSDITAEHTGTQPEPEYLWGIGIDGNVLTVKKCPYGVNAAWEGVYVLPSAQLAAIEFDGKWVLPPDASSYTLITEESPWIFYVNDLSELYVQKGLDETTRKQLDTSVTTLDVCRGFSSEIFKQQDQGLICLYIKSGEVYYYSLEESLEKPGQKDWVGPRKVLIPGVASYQASSATLARLNDYRLGLCITTNTENYWLITVRTYVNQGTPPEYFTATMSNASICNMLPAENSPILSGGTFIPITAKLAEDGLSATIQCSHPFRIIDSTVATRQFMSKTKRVLVTSLRQLDEITLQVTFDTTAIMGEIFTWPTTCYIQCLYEGKYWGPLASGFMAVSAATTEELFRATLTPSIVATLRGIETHGNTLNEHFNTTLAIQSEVTMDPITKQVYKNLAETFNCVCKVDAVVTLELVGDIPI